MSSPQVSSDKAMHILVLPSFYHDPERVYLGSFFKEQALALQAAGAKVGVVFEEGRRLQSFSPSKLRRNHFQKVWEVDEGLTTLRRLGWNTLSQTQLGGLLYVRLYENLVEKYIKEKGKPDIIHAHFSVWGGEVARRVSKRHGIPYVVTEQSSSIPGNTVPARLVPVMRSIYAGAAAVIAVSDGLARALVPFLDGRAASVVPNLVHTDFFRPSDEPVPDFPRIFFSAAHLIERKGVDILLRAWALHFKGKEEYQLRIAGAGPLRQQLEELAVTLGVASNVHFLGPLPRGGVRDEMSRAHVYVLSSWVETFGVVVIEALSSGLPVVATICCGPEETLTPEVGILVNPGDIEAMGDALWKMAVEPVCTPDLARQEALLRFSPPVIAERILGVFRKCLSTQENARPDGS